MAPKADRDPFTQAVINLRSHTLKCAACRFDYGDPDPIMTCQTGMKIVMEVARSADKLLEAKRHAVSTINHYIYACPDISAHGDAYALTAQPLSVNGVQEGLF